MQYLSVVLGAAVLVQTATSAASDQGIAGGSGTLAPSAQSADLSVVILGSGAPRYDSTRAGPSAAIRVGSRYSIVDAGNGVQGRLQQAGIALEQIDAILITHHHLDHDQELMPLVITTLVRGQKPEIYGTNGTEQMIEFMKTVYAEDIVYRMGRSPAADVDLATVRARDLMGGEQFSIGAMAVRTAAVQHTIATVAYRFDVGPQSIVISGDLTYSESLVELARGADVLVIDSGVLPGGETPGRGGRGGGAGRAAGAGGAAGRANNQGAARGAGRGGRAGAGAATTEGGAQAQRAHPSLAEVASMASQAGVPCLVLTHLNQTTVDEAATREIFQPLYTGKVVVAADLMEVSAACVVSKKG